MIDRRHGLSNEAKTLEELGDIYKLARERIRQIEAGGLRMMRKRIQRHLSASVIEHGEEHWQVLANNADFVVARDLPSVRRQLSPWFALALKLCELTLEDWLDSYAQRFVGGWVAPDWNLDDLVAIRANLEPRLKSTIHPCALACLTTSEMTSRARAVLELTDWHMFGTYVAAERPGLRIRRALRLHAILAGSGHVMQILDLLAEYRAQTSGDPCSARDCEIVMEAQKHLFLEVFEDMWTALGPAGAVPPVQLLLIQSWMRVKAQI